MLLWYLDEPSIPSGTVLQVKIRSNIEQSWITLVPKEYSSEEKQLAMVPLPHLEFFRTKGGAEKYAASFAEYAQTYAETLQDGLPIRDKPENNARRTYRLKQGEIIKILGKAEGVEAISTTGTPLEGSWFKVLTQSGSTGYCFSYRLRMFEHSAGSLDMPVEADTANDRELDVVLGRIWYPEFYGTMINSGRIDLDVLSKNYSFTAGIANGRARLHLEKGDADFPYRRITKTGDRSWNFEGASLDVTLRSESALEVRWEEPNGTKRSETFVSLPVSVENVVNQEKERRQNKLQALYVRGPSFESANYGVLTIDSAGAFSWPDINSLPEGMLSGSALGSGVLDMDYYLSGDMAERYTGALSLRLNSAGGSRRTLIFAYTLDNQGLRMEYIPPDYASGRTISRRAPSPLVIFFNAEN